MFDLGFDVPTTTEYQKNMDILLSMFDEDVSFDEVQSIEFDRDVSSSNREALQELDQAFFCQRGQKMLQPQIPKRDSILSRIKNYKSWKKDSRRLPEKAPNGV